MCSCPGSSPSSGSGSSGGGEVVTASGGGNAETVDGMPVYYGGDLYDLYDSDDSDWENPRDLAYAEYVDQYNFDVPEGFELKVFDRSKPVDVPVMMVGEVTGPGHVRQKLSSCSLPGADIVCM